MTSIPLGLPCATSGVGVDSDFTPPHSPAAEPADRSFPCAGKGHEGHAGKLPDGSLRPCPLGGVKPTGRPRTGRVARIRAHLVASFTGADFALQKAPTGFNAEQQRQWNIKRQALAHKHARRDAPKFIREAAPSIEASEASVAWAIPDGCVKISHASEALRALDQTPEYQQRFKPTRARIKQTLLVLLDAANPGSMTTHPGLTQIATRIGRSKRSAQHYINALESYGLIGRVASGRSAKYVAMATNRPQDEATNQAACFVLCRPRGRGMAPWTTEQDKAAELGLDKSFTPSPKGGSLSEKETPSRAHTRDTGTGDQKQEMEPLRGHQFLRHGASAVHPHHPESRTGHFWPSHRTIANDKAALAAAAEMATLAPDLRVFSRQDLRSMFRTAFMSGYTIADCLHALNYRPSPEGSPREREAWAALPQRPEDFQLGTHRATSHIAQLRGAIRARIAAWTQAGEFIPSRTQRQRAESAQGRAQAQAAQQRRQERATQTPTIAATAATGAAAARAALRAAGTPQWMHAN